MNRSQELFDDRYGAGAFSTLATMLEEPCTTFAAIAHHFGVTRERVRQWHLTLCPDAPRGHERKRLCAARRSRQALFRDPLFRAFYRHARAHFAPGRVALVTTRRGPRKRMVRVDGHLVGIRQARVKPKGLGPAYRLSGAAAAIAFVYYQLGEEDFLFVPRAILPHGGSTYSGDGTSPLDAFRNTFAALELPGTGHSSQPGSQQDKVFMGSHAAQRVNAWRAGDRD